MWKIGYDHKRPLPDVSSFEHDTVTTEQIVSALAKAGGCIIRNAVTPANLSSTEQDTRPWPEADKPWAGDFFPIQTRRVNGLAEKSKAFMEKIVCYQLYQDVCTAMLTSTVKNYLGQDMHESVSRPQLHNTIVFSIGSGASAQPLHRDDMVHHRISAQMTAEEYKIGQDTAIGFSVGGKKTTKEHGATRFIPGSHLWDQDTPPTEDLAVYAELNPGDAFIMLYLAITADPRTRPRTKNDWYTVVS